MWLAAAVAVLLLQAQAETEPTAEAFAVNAYGLDYARINWRTYLFGDGATKISVWIHYGTDPGFASYESLGVQYDSATRRVDSYNMLTNLVTNTTYYARLFMSNNVGNVGYRLYNKTTPTLVSFTTTGYDGTPAISSNLNYEVFTYTTDAVYKSKADEQVEVLLVGGGGAGATGNYSGGGGGGGGVLHLQSVLLEKDKEYTVKIGRGGFQQSGVSGAPENGGDTLFGSYRAYGGGAGGEGKPGSVGASGGGGGYNNYAGGAALVLAPMQGCAGAAGSGMNGGGGGGATHPGVKASKTTGENGGDGGDGYDCDITGENHCYGSGGGSGSCDSRRPNYGVGGKESGGTGYISSSDGTNARDVYAATAGVNGLGGGGGGGGYPNSSAGRGGKGTVIIRRIALSYGPNPILDGVVTNAILQTSAQLAVSIASIGDNASSATCELRWGDSPSSLSRTAAYSGSITGAGQYAVDVGITLGCTYYGKFVVVNNNGKSAETAVFSFIALARKLRATGGDVVFDDGDYRVMMFTNFVETAYLDVQQGALVEALFVGGGGAGGGSNTAGGGGGGGVLHVAEFPITVGRWPVTVGAGGVPSPSKGNGGNGGDTVFLGTVAYGGGGGASDGTGLKGASGGGGGASASQRSEFIEGQGMAGGYGRGGGGGATEMGGLVHAVSVTNIVEDPETHVLTTNVVVYTSGGGNGGAGYGCVITGESHCYGSGGGSGMNSNSASTQREGKGGQESGGDGADAYLPHARSSGYPGVAGLGGGGGGASHYNNNFGYGGAGGSGCVILRYQVRGINEGFFIRIR